MPNHDGKHEGLLAALSRIIEQRRQELRISQEELAKRTGLSRTYLSDIERGLRNISVTTLSKIAHAMHTRASTLLALAEQPEPHVIPVQETT